MKRSVYVVGPMTGIKNFNHGLFNEAEKVLSSLGFAVISPAKLPIGLAYKDYLSFGLLSVNVCDFIYCLPGWQNSSGAKLEINAADCIDKKVYESLSDIPGHLFSSKPLSFKLDELQKQLVTFE